MQELLTLQTIYLLTYTCSVLLILIYDLIIDCDVPSSWLHFEISRNLKDVTMNTLGGKLL